MSDEPLKWSDLLGMDPNYTYGMETVRFLQHGRGECEKGTPCALCLLDEAQAEIRRQRQQEDKIVTLLQEQISLHMELIEPSNPGIPIVIEVSRVMDILERNG